MRPFLFNLFSDRDIIRLGPPFLQRPLAYLIALLRSGKTRDAYALIGGKSPINEITRAQAEALERALEAEAAGMKLPPLRVYVGMRYWNPRIEDVMRGIYSRGIRRLLAVSLYPQYSVATTGSSLSHLRKVLAAYPGMETHAVESWHDDPLYIEALAAQIRRGIDGFGEALAAVAHAGGSPMHLLFSAHSLPVKFIEEGDPYVTQITGTIQAVTKKIDVPWSLSYQSKSGPVAWLEPSTEQKLQDLAREGIKNLLVVPVSFVSDHIETLYEIDILYKDLAAGLGIHLERIRSLNTAPAFVEALKGLVLKGLREAEWEE